MIDTAKEYNIIGWGNTAEVFEVDNARILKLFREGFPTEEIEREWRTVTKIRVFFADTPKALEMVSYKNRQGIVYEKVAGDDLLQAIIRHPFSAGKYARQLAEVHCKMHSVEADLDNTLKQKLKWEISKVQELSEREKEILLGRVDEIPDDNKLCHLDFYPGNVMYSVAEERFFVIDWMTSACGYPIADVARTMVLLTYGEPDRAKAFTRLIIRAMTSLFRKNYFKRYAELSGITIDKINKLIPVIAAARLSENITGRERKRLAELVKNNIGNCL